MPQPRAPQQASCPSVGPPQVVAVRPITREELVSEGRIVDGAPREGGAVTNFDGQANLVVAGPDNSRSGMVDTLQHPAAYVSQFQQQASVSMPPLSTTPGLPYASQIGPESSYNSPLIVPRQTASPMPSYLPPVAMPVSPLMLPIPAPVYSAAPMATNFRSDLLLQGGDPDGLLNDFGRSLGRTISNQPGIASPMMPGLLLEQRRPSFLH